MLLFAPAVLSFAGFVHVEALPAASKWMVALAYGGDCRSLACRGKAVGPALLAACLGGLFPTALINKGAYGLAVDGLAPLDLLLSTQDVYYVTGFDRHGFCFSCFHSRQCNDVSPQWKSLPPLQVLPGSPL